MQLDPNFTDIQSAVEHIIEDLRTVKHPFLKKLPFEPQFGRKPNTCFAFLRDSFLDNSDRKILES